MELQLEQLLSMELQLEQQLMVKLLEYSKLVW
jgi:hypothetical protein